MDLTPLKTKHYVHDALHNERLRASVDKATQTSLAKRKDKKDQIPYWEHLRHKAHSIKKDVMEHLDTYLETFEQKCRDNGIHVHWAVDAAEARQIILGIARDKNAKSIVKSKSLTTEELHLNDFLANNNIEALETDLGEYIVQLLGQIPSHLTAPALHLNRQDIGKVFHEKLGVDYTEDPNELLTIARTTLRQKFLNADIGISGVNFAIAGSGSVVVIENEANARLTVGVPKTHIAVMGIEKLIPDMEALPVFLKLLAPSATGQKASVYVNIVGGPAKDIAGEGPDDMHIVLLDNGRSRMLADPQLRESLFCIRCGACLNVCPIYQQIGGHAYGWVYMGPIGITLIPQYLGEIEGKYSSYLSSLCGACYEICPVRINIPHHLLKLRNQVIESNNGMKIEKLGMGVWSFLARHPQLYRFATWFPGKFQMLLPKGVAFPAPGYTRERALGTFDKKGFRKRYLKLIKNSQN